MNKRDVDDGLLDYQYARSSSLEGRSAIVDWLQLVHDVHPNQAAVLVSKIDESSLEAIGVALHNEADDVFESMSCTAS